MLLDLSGSIIWFFFESNFTIDSKSVLNFCVLLKVFFVWYISQYFHFYQKSDLRPIFKYNVNAKYSTKDLKGWYTGNGFFRAGCIREWKKPYTCMLKASCRTSLKIDIFCSASKGCDECPLSNTLWTKFYNGQGK